MVCIVVTMMTLVTIVVLLFIVKSIPKTPVWECVRKLKKEKSKFVRSAYVLLLIFQLLRIGTWGVFLGVSIALIGVPITACGGDVSPYKYIFCAFYELLERCYPTGRGHPFCT